MAEHGVSTGKCQSHARIRDDDGKAIGFRPCKNSPRAGGTVCNSHGARAPQVANAAAQTVAMDKAVRELRLGGRVVIDPAEAMLESVYESQANVNILKYQVTQLLPSVGPGAGELEGDDGEPYMDDIDRSELGSTIAGRVDPANWKAAPHVLVVMYNDERERLMRFSKMCRDTGVEEHRVQLAERMATQLIDVNTTVLEGFISWILQRLDQGSLTPEVLGEAQRTVVPQLMRKAIEGRVLGQSA